MFVPLFAISFLALVC